MGQRRDTGVARHTGGWIVLASGLLALCLLETSTDAPVSPPAAESLSEADRPVALQDLPGFPELRIDINAADEAELSCIEGIGPALAQRIVEHRQRVGRFQTLDELDNVPGVGPQLIRRLQAAIEPLVPTQTQPKPESEFAVTAPARLVGRTPSLPSNEPLHD